MLLPGYEQFYSETLKLLEKLTAPENKQIAFHINTLDTELCEAAERRGYRRQSNESRWQAGLLFENYCEKQIDSEELLRRVTKVDIPIRAKYSALPTGHAVTAAEYEVFFDSEYYHAAEKYVIHLNQNDEIAGFLTWWIDESSKTASLEAVAILPEFRRQGIMRRAITDGLNHFKAQRFSLCICQHRQRKSGPVFVPKSWF